MLRKLFATNLYKNNRRKYLSSKYYITITKAYNIDVITNSTLSKELDKQTYEQFRKLAKGITCVEIYEDYNSPIPNNLIDIGYYTYDVYRILEKIKN